MAAAAAEEEDRDHLDELIDDYYKEGNSLSDQGLSEEVKTAIPHGHYTIPNEFSNVKALIMADGEMRFGLNYSAFNYGTSYDSHSIATTMNCFGLEALEFVDLLLSNRQICLPFWAVRVRDEVTVTGYILQPPLPIKWNLIHAGKSLQLSTANVVSQGFGKCVMKALEKWMLLYQETVDRNEDTK